MGKLHSFKRHLNAEKVQIAEAKAYDQEQAAKALAQERKENDSKLIQEVLEVVEETSEEVGEKEQAKEAKIIIEGESQDDRFSRILSTGLAATIDHEILNKISKEIKA